MSKLIKEKLRNIKTKYALLTNNSDKLSIDLSKLYDNFNASKTLDILDARHCTEGGFNYKNDSSITDKKNVNTHKNMDVCDKVEDEKEGTVGENKQKNNKEYDIKINPQYKSNQAHSTTLYSLYSKFNAKLSKQNKNFKLLSKSIVFRNKMNRSKNKLNLKRHNNSFSCRALKNEVKSYGENNMISLKEKRRYNIKTVDKKNLGKGYESRERLKC